MFLLYLLSLWSNGLKPNLFLVFKNLKLGQLFGPVILNVQFRLKVSLILNFSYNNTNYKWFPISKMGKQSIVGKRIGVLSTMS